MPVFDGCHVFYYQTSKQGIGVALLKQAKRKAKEDAYKFAVLQTETNNPAQHLYESIAWQKDKDLHYIWKNESLK